MQIEVTENIFFDEMKKQRSFLEAVEKKRLMEDSSLSPREKSARMKLSEAIKRVYDEAEVKLASVIATAYKAAMTAAALIVLAVNSRSDGLRDYQEFILPRLLRLETGFLDGVRSAENASGEWRAYYFENAHRQVRDILRAARLDRPKGYAARKKHREFIRYYELLDLTFNNIAMQLTVNPNLDYVRELTDRVHELKPTRDAWAQWAEPRQNAMQRR